MAPNRMKTMMPRKRTAKQPYYQGIFSLSETTKYQGPRPVIYRSKLELRAMLWAENNANVLAWTSEPFPIPYVYENKQRNYYIDLIAKMSNGETWLIEVKPAKDTLSTHKDYSKNREKWLAAIEYAKTKDNMHFKILTEKVLS